VSLVTLAITGYCIAGPERMFVLWSSTHTCAAVGTRVGTMGPDCVENHSSQAAPTRRWTGPAWNVPGNWPG
jgi:hypothetical protein